MEKQLPKNWVETSPLQISKIIRGVSYGKTDAFQVEFDNSCLILRGGNIQDGEIIDGKDNVYVPLDLIKKEQFIQEHDVVIVGSTGSKNLIGKAATSLYNSDKISFGAFLMNIRASEPINKRYFSYYFQTNYYREAIRNLAGGVNINNIRKEYIENLYFPLPPLAEQNRIVAKLDTLFAQLETIKASMAKIPVLLKEFRQQVLTQAVTGKLTEEWRKGKELEDLVLKLNINNDYKLDKLPKGWKHGIISDISKVKGGKRLPKGDELVNENTGFPYIRARDLKKGTVLTENMMYLKEETQFKIKNYTVNTGDLYITIVGAKIGDAGIIPEEMNGANLTENAVKITNLHEKMFNEYFSIWLRSTICQTNIQQTIMSAAQGKLALTRINQLPIYLPTLEEQQEIVSRVESLFAKADTIEQQYQSLKEKIDTLPQALLHKAFKGELTKQLESDGDARELLLQIQELKGATGKKVKSKTTKKT